MTPDRVAEAFEFQSKACAELGSPFMGRLMALFAQEPWPKGLIRDRVFGWPGDLGPRFQSVPLRLAGALHALVLQGHSGLRAVYPPADVSDAALWGAVSAALVSDAAAIDRFIDSAPQTNEVRRSAALIPLGHWLAERFGLPIRSSELGASGGLNLRWDRYALDIPGGPFGPSDPVLTLRPTWSGPPPPTARPRISDCAGVDLNPLDPARPEGAVRLQAYLWPDQPERLSLTRAAIAAADSPVKRAEAIDWLAARLAPFPDPGHLHLIYSTIAWQYFPADAQARGTALIEAAGAKATDSAPLAWYGMENDGGARGAALTLRLWPGNLTIPMGRADFHGRWIDWQPLAPD